MFICRFHVLLFGFTQVLVVSLFGTFSSGSKPWFSTFPRVFSLQGSVAEAGEMVSLMTPASAGPFRRSAGTGHAQNTKVFVHGNEVSTQH